MLNSYKPKKSLGQNFLTDRNILQSIVEAGEISAGDTVIEIGPGTGSLTDELVATGARIIAVEKDDALVLELREKYKNTKNVEIIHDDILQFNVTGYMSNVTCYKLIGNIPYYLTSHLFRIILTTWPAPQNIVFTVQKEVAQRIVAKPPNMSMISLLVQCYGTPSIIKIIKRGSFNPAPKVDSAILKIIMPSENRTPSANLLDIASRGFAHPRKMLRASLPEEKLLEAQIDPKRRPGTLTIEEWERLAKLFTNDLV